MAPVQPALPAQPRKRTNREPDPVSSDPLQRHIERFSELVNMTSAPDTTLLTIRLREDILMLKELSAPTAQRTTLMAVAASQGALVEGQTCYTIGAKPKGSDALEADIANAQKELRLAELNMMRADIVKKLIAWKVDFLENRFNEKLLVEEREILKMRKRCLPASRGAQNTWLHDKPVASAEDETTGECDAKRRKRKNHTYITAWHPYSRSQDCPEKTLRDLEAHQSVLERLNREFEKGRFGEG
ncbi:MAG: hypothetical protein MMC33_009013 [Icmadophila ericetorum]|nr:hypothetical protein [Icmadophila ericetorum]